MVRPDYSFQTALENKVYQKLEAKDASVVVLAAAPAAGKTQMGLHIIKRYMEDHPGSIILVLTHGQVLLREQWYQYILDLDPNFEFLTVRRNKKAPNKKYRVLVAIPQTLRIISESLRVDLLVVDEAHHWYRSPTVKQLIKKVQPKKQLLLTGTPSGFIKNGFPTCGITVSELLQYGVVCDPIIELVESSYAYGINDFNEKLEINSSVITEEDTIIDLGTLLGQIIQRLTAEHRADPIQYEWVLTTTDWRGILKKLKKTMFVCRSQKQAILIHHYFKTFGINAEISISEISDSTASAFLRFEENDDCYLMIVVNRGILGYSYTELFNVCDFTMSLNVDRVFQLMCRAIRNSKYPQNQNNRKLFFKFTNNVLSTATYHVMSYVVAMSQSEYYYACTEYQATKIPVPKEFVDLITNTGTIPERKNPPNLLDLPKLTTFIDLARRGTNPDSFAYTDFKTVRKFLSEKSTFSVDAILSMARNYPTYTAFRNEQRPAYKFLARQKKLDALAEIFPEHFKYHTTQNGKLVLLPINLNEKETIAEITKYKNRAEIKLNDVRLYKFLLRKHRKLLDRYLPKAHWDILSVKKKAAKAKKSGESRRQFLKKNGGISDYLSRTKQMKVLDDFFVKKLVGKGANIRPSEFRWTPDILMEEAKKFPNLQSFKKINEHGYRWALKHGLIKKVKRSISRKRINILSLSCNDK